MSKGWSSWPIRSSSASISAGVVTWPSGRSRKSSFTPGRMHQSSGISSIFVAGGAAVLGRVVVPGRVHVGAVVGGDADPLDRPALALGQFVDREAGERAGELRRPLVVPDVVDLHRLERRVGRDVVVERDREVDESAQGFSSRSGPTPREPQVDSKSMCIQIGAWSTSAGAEATTTVSNLALMEARIEALLDQLHRDGVAFDAARSRPARAPSQPRARLRPPAPPAGVGDRSEAPARAGQLERLLDDLARRRGRRQRGRDGERRPRPGAARRSRAPTSPRPGWRGRSSSAAKTPGRPSSRAPTPRSTSSSSTPNGPSTRPTGPTSSGCCRPGGLLAVDNVISHAEEVADLRTLIAADRRVSEALVPIGAGLLLVTRLVRPAG